MPNGYQITHRKELEAVPFDLDGRFPYRSESLDLIHLILKSGEVVGTHSQPIPVSFYVLSGEGILTVGSDNIPAVADMMIDVEPHAMRSWRNTGEAPLKILVIKQLT